MVSLFFLYLTFILICRHGVILQTLVRSRLCKALILWFRVCVMDAPNPKRPRPCHDPSSVVKDPSSLHLPPGFNQSNVDMTISSFLSLSDFPLFSSPLSIGCSFDRVLDKVGTSIDDGSDHDRFLDRTLQLASLLHNSTKRCIRKRATLHNSISWPLLPELTTKVTSHLLFSWVSDQSCLIVIWFQVFSMLDTNSLMQASVCCTMFNKCAMDRVCYSHIDLTMAATNVDNGVVCIMIHRAGKELRFEIFYWGPSYFACIYQSLRSLSFMLCRSLKLGSISSTSTFLLTRSCLAPLSFNHGFAGYVLDYPFLLENYCSVNYLSPLKLGVSWEAYTFTIWHSRLESPYVLCCQSVRISLIWRLLDCKFVLDYIPLLICLPSSMLFDSFFYFNVCSFLILLISLHCII